MSIQGITASGVEESVRSSNRALHTQETAPLPESWYLNWTGVAGGADNAVVYLSPDVSAYNVHYVEATAGTVDVDVSLDGTNFIAAVAGVSLITTTPATRVIEAASGVCLEIQGKFKAIRVNQKGATASNARGAHAVI